MIEHVIFDLGNVLLNIHSERAMADFAGKSKLSKSDVERFFLSELHLGFMGGQYSSNQFFEMVKEQYQLQLDFDNFFSIWNLIIGKPKDGIVSIVEKLQPRFNLSICSNTDPIHWKYCLEQYPFLKNFQQYFLSFEMKHNKPDPEVFKNILFKLKTKGEECVFIDDSYPNIEAAQKLAFHTIHAEETDKIRNQLIKSNLL